jgi:hypothetical protein
MERFLSMNSRAGEAEDISSWSTITGTSIRCSRGSCNQRSSGIDVAHSLVAFCIAHHRRRINFERDTTSRLGTCIGGSFALQTSSCKVRRNQIRPPFQRYEGIAGITTLKMCTAGLSLNSGTFHVQLTGRPQLIGQAHQALEKSRC